MNLQQTLLMGRVSTPFQVKISKTTGLTYASFDLQVNEYLSKKNKTQHFVYRILAFKRTIVNKMVSDDIQVGDLMMIDGYAKALDKGKLAVVVHKHKTLK
jgi:hypothetical protein